MSSWNYTKRSILQCGYANHDQWRFPSQTIGAIVREFKLALTKRINELHQAPGSKYRGEIIENTASATDPKGNGKTSYATSSKRIYSDIKKELTPTFSWPCKDLKAFIRAVD